jgi:DNA-binding LacI/PurR family transcriptional regulator
VFNATASDFLSSRRNKVIGVLVPVTENSLFGSTLMAIQETAINKGFAVIIGSTGYDPTRETELINQFIERRVGGVILTGLHKSNTHLVKKLATLGLPSVVIWEIPEIKDINYVGFDNRAGAYTATKYLVNLGHRRIGILAGPFSRVVRVQERLEGYLSALKEAGIARDPSLIKERIPSFFEGRSAADELLNLDEPPTAIFAASDFLAIGAMYAISQRGLRIPEDISIVGYDDIEVSAYVQPPLTTIHVDTKKIGQLGAKIIVDQALGINTTLRSYELETFLVVRKSCGPLLSL